MHRLFTLPIASYSTLRSLHYSFQYQAFNAIPLPFGKKQKRWSWQRQWAIWQDILRLLKEDSSQIAQGVFPVQVLLPESPLTHAWRIPKIFMDGIFVSWRRVHQNTKTFNGRAKKLLKDLPDYYQRNFHYQTNGYLSDRSAELYEHQVELLFGGAADAMRRLILPPMKMKFKNDGEGLTFLELGCGTGRATRFVKLCFPKAKIVSVDLSYPYIKQAQKKNQDLDGIDYLQANASELPFSDANFDAVFSVFMFHELPKAERLNVLLEARRVLKKSGLMIVSDSIQKGDKPEAHHLLDQFPLDFHEPFYKNYVNTPMNELFRSAKFKSVQSKLGFVAKACWAEKL